MAYMFINIDMEWPHNQVTSMLQCIMNWISINRRISSISSSFHKVKCIWLKAPFSFWPSFRAVQVLASDQLQITLMAAMLISGRYLPSEIRLHFKGILLRLWRFDIIPGIDFNLTKGKQGMDDDGSVFEASAWVDFQLTAMHINLSGWENSVPIT